jgi:hypothetical protein
MLNLGTQIAISTGPGHQPPIGGFMHEQWRKSITTLAFVLLGLGSAGVWAQAPVTPLAMKPDAPDRYVVVPGDTLWSIAHRYTDSPWRWQELWNLNKDEIKNPNRIYPGNVIVLDRSRGTLALDEQTVKLSPRVRAESTAVAAIPSIPPAMIEPFLTRPLVVEADGLEHAPTVVAAEDGRVILESGNRAFVRGMGDSKEPTWFVYRRGGPLIDPETKMTMGYEAVYLGTASVERPGDPAVIRVSTATREIGIGDKLIPAGRPEVPNYAPHAPTVTVTGQVMSIYGGTNEAGGQSVITINRGKAQGIERGNVLALYRPGAAVMEAGKPITDASGRHVLPSERYGLVFVFRVFDNVSYGLVMSLSKSVRVQDLVQNP